MINFVGTDVPVGLSKTVLETQCWQSCNPLWRYQLHTWRKQLKCCQYGVHDKSLSPPPTKGLICKEHERKAIKQTFR